MKYLSIALIGFLFIVPAVSFAQTNACFAPYSSDKNYSAEESAFTSCINDAAALQFNQQSCIAENSASTTYAWNSEHHICESMSCNAGYYVSSGNGESVCIAQTVDPVKVPKSAPIQAAEPVPVVPEQFPQIGTKIVYVQAPAPAPKVITVTKIVPITATTSIAAGVPVPNPIQESKEGFLNQIIKFLTHLF